MYFRNGIISSTSGDFRSVVTPLAASLSGTYFDTNFGGHRSTATPQVEQIGSFARETDLELPREEKELHGRNHQNHWSHPHNRTGPLKPITTARFLDKHSG